MTIQVYDDVDEDIARFFHQAACFIARVSISSGLEQSQFPLKPVLALSTSAFPRGEMGNGRCNPGHECSMQLARSLGQCGILTTVSD